MTDEQVTTYGPGGYDPHAPEGNVVGTYAVAMSAEEANGRLLLDRARLALTALAADRAQAQALAAQANDLATGAVTLTTTAAIKQLAQGIKILANQANDHARILAALTRLTTQDLDATD